MIGWHHRCAVERLPMTADFADGNGFAKEPLHGRCAEGDDQFRLNQFDLLHQVGQARLHLVHRRLAIPVRLPRSVRTAFEDVRDTHGLARETHGLDDPCQKLASYPAR